MLHDKVESYNKLNENFMYNNLQYKNISFKPLNTSELINQNYSKLKSKIYI